MSDFDWAADRARYDAGILARLESDRDIEYLRLVASGVSTWEAQRRVDAEFGRDITLARVELEIDLARLRRA